jgi:hypothetical protein
VAAKPDPEAAGSAATLEVPASNQVRAGSPRAHDHDTRRPTAIQTDHTLGEVGDVALDALPGYRVGCDYPGLTWDVKMPWPTDLGPIA